MKYSYNDISIVPAITSKISSRSECDPFDKGNLPIFTAPMSSIVNKNNFHIYEDNHIIPILPRNYSLEDRIQSLNNGKWAAFSLSECDRIPNSIYPVHICIDVANGHMTKLYDTVKQLKERIPNSIIMTGNIANPETITTAIDANVDYIRLGIGSGFGCITTSNVGVHYPIASLIRDSVKIRRKRSIYPKIIADGGIKGYADINKALALGADYVMIGSLFAKCIEASDDIYDWEGKITTQQDYNTNPLFHKFYGMASKEGQNDLYGKKKHTAEGICRKIGINTTIKQWSKNAEDYIRSAMSYCNAKTLSEFKLKTKTIIISINTFSSINE